MRKAKRSCLLKGYGVTDTGGRVFPKTAKDGIFGYEAVFIYDIKGGNIKRGKAMGERQKRIMA